VSSTRTTAVLSCLALSLGIVFASGSHAALIARAGGAAYYDDVADLTWVTDASDNTATGSPLPGRNYWGPHNAWASTLSIDGVTGWRLPSMDVNGDEVISAACTGSVACQDNEMGFLFATYGVSVADSSPLNLYPVGNAYWSSTPIAGDPVGIWAFNFSDGSQVGLNGGGNLVWAVAVQSGDVLPVPEPGTALLFGLGLAGLGCGSRRQRVVEQQVAG